MLYKYLLQADVLVPGLQDNKEQFGVVVSLLKQLYGLRYIYCWHGLSAYWSGVSTDPREQDVAKYNASLHYSEVSLSLSHLLPPCPVLSILGTPS